MRRGFDTSSSHRFVAAYVDPRPVAQDGPSGTKRVGHDLHGPVRVGGEVILARPGRVAVDRVIVIFYTSARALIAGPRSTPTSLDYNVHFVLRAEEQLLGRYARESYVFKCVGLLSRRCRG